MILSGKYVQKVPLNDYSEVFCHNQLVLFIIEAPLYSSSQLKMYETGPVGLKESVP